MVYTGAMRSAAFVPRRRAAYFRVHRVVIGASVGGGSRLLPTSVFTWARTVPVVVLGRFVLGRSFSTTVEAVYMVPLQASVALYHVTMSIVPLWTIPVTPRLFFLLVYLSLSP